MNMLSAKKVRQHGLQSSRWKTRDKLTQYKGLINLFTRDRKILSFDAAVARKKQVKELKQLRGDIKHNRADLDNAIQGDRQTLRNTLAEHRDLQLAFQNLHPSRVVDHLHQGNFNKRKLLDRLDYRMKQKTQTLISLKLELAEMEDRLKYEDVGQIPVEKDAQIITGKVQDAILKKEAALSVRQTYKSILNILKKDSLYFDAVLETLRHDSFLQSKCMVRTTELGQLATEYLDDRKQEFKDLERAVKRDMKAREQSLRVVRQEVKDLTNNMSLLIRRDSDINIGKVVVPRTELDDTLQNDVEMVQNILKTIQDTVYVSSFQNIFPCLIDQHEQSERLRELFKKVTKDRDILAYKKSNGEIMYNELLYTISQSTFEYKKKKTELLEEIDNQKKHKQQVKKVDVHQNELVVKVRSALMQLLKKCAVVSDRDDRQRQVARARVESSEQYSKKMTSAGYTTTLPPRLENEGIKIIDLLQNKLRVLMNEALPPLDPETQEVAYKFFQQFTSETCAAIQYEHYEMDDSLVADVMIEDAQVPTYNDIKTKSKDLVAISTVNEDLIPMFTPKKKKKFKFK